MPERTKPPFRADHVGSLIRPDALIKAREQADEERDCRRRAQAHPARRHPRRGAPAGGSRAQARHRRRVQSPLVAPRLHAEIRQCEARPLQDEGALPYRRGRPRQQRRRRSRSWASWRGRGDGGIFVDDFKFLISIARATPKITIPSPTVMHFRGGREAIDAAAYPDIAEFYDDLARLYREEIADLAQAGCRYLQIDEVNLAYLCDPRTAPRGRQYRRGPGDAAEDLRQAAQRHDPGPPARHDGVHASLPRQFRRRLGGGRRLRADRRALVQPDRRRRLLPRIRQRARRRLRAAALPAQGQGRGARASSPPRAASSRPRTSSSAASTRRRSSRRSEQLALSPQCGFSSGIGGNTMNVDGEIAKLRLVVETAREVWGSA